MPKVWSRQNLFTWSSSILMVGLWSTADVKEETPLYDDLDPLKEWVVDPDRVQVQNANNFSNVGLDRCEISTEVKLDIKGEIFGSSIDEKMEKVSLLEVSDLSQGEVGLNGNGVENDSEMNGTKTSLEDLKENGGENDLKRNGTKTCIEDLKVNGGENDLEMNGTKACLEDLKSDQLSQEGTDEVESSEEESAFVTTDSDSEDSSSDESSSNESLSITKSLSSSDDEDGGMQRIKEVEELEEGEVRDFDAQGMDFLIYEEGERPKGPIRSKHEVEDLPPVPKVEVSLQPHHQTLPVGVISSIMGNRVIVEGSVKHNPLDEGSILWVTETRAPLGLIDEIFGPVKNPYYVVRYNTELEVPAGVGVDAAISFVVEFAWHILNDKELYKKGYDASGENDEKNDYEVEFSDDEKEAEHRRSLRQSKRPTNDGKGVNLEARVDRRRKNFMGSWIQHKDKKNQQTSAPFSIDLQHATDVLPKPNLPRNPGVGPGCWNSSWSATNANVAPPPRVAEFPQAMQPANFFGNPSQQLLIQHPADAPWVPGFSSHVQNTGLQQELAVQLQNQNLLLNNLVNMVFFQQQLQQLISNPGSTLPWFGAAPSLPPIEQNNFAPPPIFNGLDNLPGTAGLGNEQAPSLRLMEQNNFAPPPFFNGLTNFRGTNEQAPSLRPMKQNNFAPPPIFNGLTNLPGTAGLGNEQALSLRPTEQNNFAPPPIFNGLANLPGTVGLGSEQAPSLRPMEQNNFAPPPIFNGLSNLRGAAGLGNEQAPSLRPMEQNNFAPPPIFNGLTNFPKTAGLGNEQAPSLRPIEQNNFASPPSFNGLANLPGTAGLGNEQAPSLQPVKQNNFAPPPSFNGLANLPGTTGLGNEQAPSLQPMEQNNFAPPPSFNGLPNLPGTAGLGHEQAPSLRPMEQNNFAPPSSFNGLANLPGTAGLGNEQAPSLGPMEQNNFAPRPSFNGLANLPGTAGLASEQAPSVRPMEQNNFAPPPSFNGLSNLPGTAGLRNQQIHGQALLPFAPSMQFNAGRSGSLQFNARSSGSLQFNAGSSSSRGRRPYQRGGGRFFGRRGQQNT